LAWKRPGPYNRPETSLFETPSLSFIFQFPSRVCKGPDVRFVFLWLSAQTQQLRFSRYRQTNFPISTHKQVHHHFNSDFYTDIVLFLPYSTKIFTDWILPVTFYDHPQTP
jgi:hypothetical protein